MTKIKTSYQIVLMLLLFMIGLLACGIPEFLGSSEENSPTSPCLELIPSPTPIPTPIPTPTSEATISKMLSPVSVIVADMALDSLENLHGSGIDVLFTWVNDRLIIEFSHPIKFATLAFGEHNDSELLQAFDASNDLVDMDRSGTELSVFGDGIKKLVLIAPSGTIEQLSFLPQNQ